MLNRRTLLTAAGASLAASALEFPQLAWAAGGLKLAPGVPFSFERLVSEAQGRAARAYEPPPALPEKILTRIDYEAHGKIKFNTDYALFKDGPGEFPVTFFALGRYFPVGVNMFVISGADPQAS